MDIFLMCVTVRISYGILVQLWQSLPAKVFICNITYDNLKSDHYSEWTTNAVWWHNYTPGIYADGYIVFAFPFVSSYVRSLFRNVRGIYVKVYDKVSLVVYIS